MRTALQAPLSYPSERAGRLGTVAIGDSFPHGVRPSPLLIYDAVSATFPPRYDAGWSNYYARYPRRPDLCYLLAPYVASRYKAVCGVGKVGWLSPGDNSNCDPHGFPQPPWAIASPNAVQFEIEQREAKG